ncbi:hypothetical protein B0H21DRAFT_701311 [Amylocystis lapponica]|nr:hypothetical protein B0H21DRAFT_701311 [Amylocystis lapponica]
MLTQRRVVENYCILASSALLYCDWAMTFTSEVQRIWRKKFTGATFVFLLNRYVALAERGTLTTTLFLQTLQDSVRTFRSRLRVCVPVLRLDDTLTNISYLMSGVFIVLRVWGIWGKDWRPHWLDPFMPRTDRHQCRACFLIYLDTQYVPLAFGPPLYGCGSLWVASGSTISACPSVGAATGAVSIASNAILLILTWVKTYGIKRESSRLGMHTPLATLLLRDGTPRFHARAPNLRTYAAKRTCPAPAPAPAPPHTPTLTLARSFVVIFLSRFMLDLRGVYLADEDDTPSTALQTSTSRSELHFASTILGNIGAPLASAEWGRGRSADTYRSVYTEEEDDDDNDDDAIELSKDPLMVDFERPADEIELEEIVCA